MKAKPIIINRYIFIYMFFISSLTKKEQLKSSVTDDKGLTFGFVTMTPNALKVS